jgi:hypothetical protein
MVAAPRMALPSRRTMVDSRMKSAFCDTRVAFLTQHGKERALAPLFLEELGARVEVVRGFDTDTLGTFTREVPREGTQLAAARRKAEIAIERSGLALGLGSEGAFVPGPFGLGSWNIEVLVYLDRARAIEVVGRAHAAGRHLHATVRTREELDAFAARAGFPSHALVIRPNDERDPRIAKGIAAAADLASAFERARGAAADGAVFVESELRAHLNPTRMATIEAAGRDLVARLRCACPACGTAGFGVARAVAGLPCGDCGAPTREAAADEFACVRCEHVEIRPRTDGPAEASPAVCDYCNP